MSRGIRILLVDDVPEIGELFRRFVTRLEGARVDLVVEEEPLAALERLPTEPFDAVISDYRMPRMNGLDLLVEAGRLQPAAYRVLLTGLNELPVEAEKLRAARVHAYVHKPVPKDDALQLLRDIARHDDEAMGARRARAEALERRAQRHRGPLDVGD